MRRLIWITGALGLLLAFSPAWAGDDEDELRCAEMCVENEQRCVASCKLSDDPEDCVEACREVAEECSDKCD